MNDLQKLSMISGEVDALYHEAAYKLGRSDSAMTILYVLLDSREGIGLSEICRLSGMRKQTLNSALRKLEQEGSIYLEADGKKNKIAFLTDSGKTEAAKSAGILRRIEAAALGKWTEEEITLYLELSQRFLDDFRTLVSAIPVQTD